jgi:hydroxymethylbilane synthase
VIRIATRASALARWQAERVGDLLGRDVEFVLITTTGDRDQTSDLHAIGGQGVFTKEVQVAVLEGRADVAVHSAKDLPTETPAGLVLACVPERTNPYDALVGAPLQDLVPGACIGTGSVRRRAQLAAARPDLTFGPLRGNIETRLRKRGELGYDAIVVAFAALERLGLVDQMSELLDPLVMLPQVAQGALAAECRIDDARTLDRLRAIDRPPAHRAVDTERAFLADLGGGCDLPVGALAQIDDRAGTIFLDALIASFDGHIVLRTRVAGDDPHDVGITAARDLLDKKGGRSLMEDVA